MGPRFVELCAKALELWEIVTGIPSQVVHGVVFFCTACQQKTCNMHVPASNNKSNVCPLRIVRFGIVQDIRMLKLQVRKVPKKLFRSRNGEEWCIFWVKASLPSRFISFFNIPTELISFKVFVQVKVLKLNTKKSKSQIGLQRNQVRFFGLSMKDN